MAFYLYCKENKNQNRLITNIQQKKDGLQMFCDNINYNTARDQQIHDNYCQRNTNKQQIISYNYLPTQQSQRNPSNLYQNNFPLKYQTNQNNAVNQNLLSKQANLDLMNYKTQRQYKVLKTIQRNKNIASILTIVLAFAERIQVLKQKLCGYPAQSFSPAKFFNVLDLTEKGFVDIYDFKKFINNQKIQQKDIITLFKKVNGSHVKQNTKLSYFGYLNLIKPYFNQQLARDLLMRDSLISKKSRNSSKMRVDEDVLNNEMLQATQESVLLVFQQLLVLHSICTCEHEQAKEMLMNEFMLNLVQIKEIIGLSSQSLQNKRISTNSSYQSKSSKNFRHRSPLSVIFQFIENNCQFQVEFKQMKYLLSYINTHQYSISEDKYLDLLFLPINSKKQLIRELQKKRSQFQTLQSVGKYMNVYLNKQNLLNKGNTQYLRQYLNQKYRNSLSSQHLQFVDNNFNTSKPNFLQFVHPQSIQRLENKLENKKQINRENLLSQNLQNQHPFLLINKSNKIFNSHYQVNQNQNQRYSQKQLTNNSSIPQQNIKVNIPKQIKGQLYHSKGLLKNQFYQEGDINHSNISKTPFLQQFMKQSNVIKNIRKGDSKNDEKTIILNKKQLNLRDSSHISDSAFQIVDYGYDPQYDEKNSYVIQNKIIKQKNQQQNSLNKYKKQTLCSRFNQMVSQYQGGQNDSFNTKQNRNEVLINKVNKDNDQFNMRRIGQKEQNQQMANKNKNVSKNIDKNGNYMNSIGMSQSNMINESSLNRSAGINILDNFGIGRSKGNILDDFMRR